MAMRLRWLWSQLSVSVVFSAACATTPPLPAKLAPRALSTADVAAPGQHLVFVDVTNASALVRSEGGGSPCQTPCVLGLTPGAHWLTFEYERDGKKRSDAAALSVSDRPQVYRRTLPEAHIRSRAGRVTAITLWALGQAAMLTALGLLAVDGDGGVKAARQGLGYGGLGAVGLSIPLGLLSVGRTRAASVQFPWNAGLELND